MRIATIIFATLLTTASTYGQQQDTSSTFSIFLSPESCKTTLTYEHVYEESVDSTRGVRIIKANGIPEHKTGKFPNSGNPNTIKPREVTYEIPLEPKPLKEIMPGMGIRTGVLFSGVELDPFTAEFFQGTNGPNREWNITALTSTVNLGLDCNNGHVQPGGKYHYHGTPNAFLEELDAQPNEMIKVGYAADGYPIYYKYGYNNDGQIQALESSYRLKEGERPGDGKTAPDGAYDGTYFQDYEYVEGLSPLDACNGRFGKTPESEGEYYYVITDNFPSSPICFHAEPSRDFMNGPPTQGGNDHHASRQPNNRPDASQIFQRMDTDQNGVISRAEARGPLSNDFDRIDTDGNGELSEEEIRQLPQPGRRPE